MTFVYSHHDMLFIASFIVYENVLNPHLPIHSLCVENPTSGGTACLDHRHAGTTRIDAADRARIGLYVGYSVAPSVRHRYQGKGLGPFLAWRRNRGWSEDGPEPSWLDDMSPAKAAELLGAYMCELRLQGMNADTAIQALRHDYEKASRSLTVFGCSSVSATRRKRPREFDRETALSRQRAARSPITGSMMSEAITRHFPPGMVISPQNRDSAAAILAGWERGTYGLLNVRPQVGARTGTGGRPGRRVGAKRPGRQVAQVALLPSIRHIHGCDCGRGGALVTRPPVGIRTPLSTRPGTQGRVQCADNQNHTFRWETGQAHGNSDPWRRGRAPCADGEYMGRSRRLLRGG